MNEYSDQATWFELIVEDSNGKWITISDHDTREQAEAVTLPLWAEDSKINRRRGMAEK